MLCIPLHRYFRKASLRKLLQGQCKSSLIHHPSTQSQATVTKKRRFQHTSVINRKVLLQKRPQIQSSTDRLSEAIGPRLCVHGEQGARTFTSLHVSMTNMEVKRRMESWQKPLVCMFSKYKVGTDKKKANNQRNKAVSQT